MSEPIRLAIVGCTGSIGRQTLDLVAREPERFQVVALVAGSDADALTSQVERFRPSFAGLAAVESHPEFAAGAGLLAEAAAHPDADVVVNAVVGSRGLAATLAALHAGKDVALANKESLVAGGPLVHAALGGRSDRLRPVDSEHAALAQALAGVRPQEIRRLTITASGGPFRARSDLGGVTVEEALAHPTWRMGDRITIDSATLMNKGFELIEAHFLFDIEAARLGAIVHPQSIVHGIVELVDGSQVLQAAVPDMRLPIAAALSPGDRRDVGVPPLDLTKIGRLDFEPVDDERFPAVRLALAALDAGGTAPAILNAADEEAVGAFLAGRIPFLSVTRIVAEVLDAVPSRQLGSVEDVLEAERLAREAALSLIDRA